MRKPAIEPVYVIIGARIANRRVSRGLTQTELGQLLHPPISRMHMSNIENANQRLMLHTLLEICGALDCRPEDLLPHIIRV